MVTRPSSYRRQARVSRAYDYFYGPRHDLNPSMETVSWLAGTLSYTCKGVVSSQPEALHTRSDSKLPSAGFWQCWKPRGLLCAVMLMGPPLQV